MNEYNKFLKVKFNSKEIVIPLEYLDEFHMNSLGFILNLSKRNEAFDDYCDMGGRLVLEYIYSFHYSSLLQIFPSQAFQTHFCCC